MWYDMINNHYIGSAGHLQLKNAEAGSGGLGPGIVPDAVLAHGGTIAVGQNKPQGSVFIVSFPRPTSEETGI